MSICSFAAYSRIFGINFTCRWTQYKQIIGKVQSNFNVLIDILPPLTFINESLIAIDNITLINCFPEEETNASCKFLEFKCSQTNICINNSQVCDITQDCINGDDETQNCGTSTKFH